METGDVWRELVKHLRVHASLKYRHGVRFQLLHRELVPSSLLVAARDLPLSLSASQPPAGASNLFETRGSPLFRAVDSCKA